VNWSLPTIMHTYMNARYSTKSGGWSSATYLFRTVLRSYLKDFMDTGTS
jgi:hypothetical protein